MLEGRIAQGEFAADFLVAEAAGEIIEDLLFPGCKGREAVWLRLPVNGERNEAGTKKRVDVGLTLARVIQAIASMPDGFSYS